MGDDDAKLERTPLRDPLVRKLRRYVDLGREEIGLLREFRAGRQDFTAGASILEEGDPLPYCFWVSNGWAFRYRMLADGRRQIINFLLPGDFIGFYAFLFPRAEYAIEALTDVVAAPVESAAMVEMCRDHSRLFMALSWCAARDDHMLREHVVRLGRRTAYERLAHMLMELCRRLDLIDFGAGDRYDMPLTQDLLADSLGLSVVHVNRTLKALRKDGLVDYRRGQITIRDPVRLGAIAEFDRSYLQENAMPGRTADRLDGSES